ncbi:MAG: nickel-responsive transcriptional regulator NikR [Methanomassiliicoccales archaeon]|nr:MAG: nickel-responsive transcriptional regulator NikR [Methanomassiliicoccales archaeon]
MDNVTRIGVSIEPDLLSLFDEMIEKKGYGTRSEAIRDLIRDALTDRVVQDEDANVCGTITLIYNHHKGDVKEKLTDIQHQNHNLISSSIHIHLDLERCLEVLIVSGKVRDIKRLADTLGSVRGVQNGIPVMLSGEITEHRHFEDVHDHEGIHTHHDD